MSTPHETPTPTRRTALSWMAVLWGTVATAVVGVPVVGYILGPIIRPKQNQWIRLGPVGDFPLNDTRLVDMLNPDRRPWDGDSGRMAAYVRRVGDEEFWVFAINCAHLGCPVAWFAESGLFMCPCHGGVYYEDGARASGPPPRGLYTYEYRVIEGHLEIRAGILPTMYQPV